jgi:DNA-binding transcriptional ArsR family regulator
MIWNYRSCTMLGMATTGERPRIPHPETAAIDLATVMRTVGDPLRLELVRILADGRERTCHDLQTALGLPPSTGSYHLRLLREAGVTRTRAAGTQRLISLRRDDLEGRFPGLVDVLAR